MSSELAIIAVAGAAMGTIAAGVLAFAFLRDPIMGMVQARHQPGSLPKVMANRYTAFTMLACGATTYRDLTVISFLFAVFAFMGFADAWLYAQDGAPYSKHLIAGIAAALVAGVALVAIFQTGAGA